MRNLRAARKLTNSDFAECSPSLPPPLHIFTPPMFPLETRNQLKSGEREVL